VCVSHLHIFPCFSPYSRSYHDFLIFLDCQFSQHIQDPIVCVSHFPRFSVFSPQSWSYSVHFSFFKFSPLPFSRSYRVCFTFCTFFPCFLPYSRYYHDFLIFLVCQFSRHIQCPIVPVAHFPHLSVVLTYSRSYCGHF
jgi:hypothetical protein